jgi:hypothetical protein
VACTPYAATTVFSMSFRVNDMNELDKIFYNDGKFNRFIGVSKLEFSTENVIAYCYLKQWECELKLTKNNAGPTKFAQFYLNFLITGCPFEINIPGLTRRHVIRDQVSINKYISEVIVNLKDTSERYFNGITKSNNLIYMFKEDFVYAGAGLWGHRLQQALKINNQQLIRVGDVQQIKAPGANEDWNVINTWTELHKNTTFIGLLTQYPKNQ